MIKFLSFMLILSAGAFALPDTNPCCVACCKLVNLLWACFCIQYLADRLKGGSD